MFLQLLVLVVAIGCSENLPFPQHVKYHDSTILPDVTQSEMDSAVGRFYQNWRDRYLTQDPTYSDQYYVFYNYEGYSGGSEIKSCSEGHGYGMVILAYMAGSSYETDAKAKFDGMYNFYLRFQSASNEGNMGWQQKLEKGEIVSSDSNSATDGDMDIAYALLLADKQWGSDGNIDYLSAAKKVINSVYNGDVSSMGTLRIGDWATESDMTYRYATRSSDFMLSHLKDFAQYNSGFTSVKEKCIEIANHIFENYSPNTGLLPDFIVYDNTNGYKPPDSWFLESNYDGYYYYNACRSPWRLSLDYILNGNDDVLNIIKKLNDFIKTKTSNTPSSILPGYTLDGNSFLSYWDMSFVAPFLTSAMVGSENQDWLDALWSHVTSKTVSDSSYYGNSIKMINLIIASGNYWSPLDEGDDTDDTEDDIGDDTDDTEDDIGDDSDDTDDAGDSDDTGDLDDNDDDENIGVLKCFFQISLVLGAILIMF